MLKTKPTFTLGMMLLAVCLLLGRNSMTVEASGSAKAKLDCYNSGIAAVLDPTSCTTEEIYITTSTQETTNYQLVMANVTNALNVRLDPSEDAEIVGKLYKDCGGVALESRDGWTKIQSGSLIGWAKDEYLYFGEEAAELANQVGFPIAVVQSDAIRVRSEANGEAEILGYAAKGEKLVAVEIVDEQWLMVEYADVMGYIQRSYVSEEFEIDHGETYDEITARKMKEEAEKKKLVTYYGSMSASEYERLLLAALIYCEAGGESYEGKLAVGAVVCNRVRSGAYPDSLQGVIYASGQFSPAKSGKLDRVMAGNNIPQTCLDAAEETLAGYTNVGNALYFRRNNGTREGSVIGNHVFY